MALTVSSPRSSRLGTVLLVSLGAALGGCNMQKYEPTVTGSIERDPVTSNHPIIVREGADTIDIPIGSQAARLDEAATRTIKRFGAEAISRGASGVTVLMPSGSANEAAAYRASNQVIAALVAGGVPAHAVTRRPYRADPRSTEAPIRLAYPRIVAEVPHTCGHWPDQMLNNEKNEPYWNYGCATQANMAAMIAEPSDLITPRGEDPADGTRRTMVVQAYRAGKATKAETGITEAKSSSVSGGN